MFWPPLSGRPPKRWGGRSEKPNGRSRMLKTPHGESRPPKTPSSRRGRDGPRPWPGPAKRRIGWRAPPALGGPPDAAAADLARAEADAQDAADDEARARRRLEEARDDLRDAKRRGAEAEDDARQAAHALASAAQAAGSVSPEIAMPAGVATPSWRAVPRPRRT